MDDMQLNRALAERLGHKLLYAFSAEQMAVMWYGVNPDGTRWHDDYNAHEWRLFKELDTRLARPQPLYDEDQAWSMAPIPNWATDEGAALRLWVDLLAQHATTWELSLGVLDDGERYAALSHPGADWTVTAPTAARALAELALRALESGAQSGAGG